MNIEQILNGYEYLGTQEVPNGVPFDLYNCKHLKKDGTYCMSTISEKNLIEHYKRYHK